MAETKLNLVVHREELLQLRMELSKELESILSYWKQYMIDEEEGGFYGSVDNNNIADPEAVKGLVLNSRICWTFSAAYGLTKNKKHLDLATRAFEYISTHFIDRQHGGAFWSVDRKGKMAEGRKQIYGQAFCIYGLTEYYKVSADEEALAIARQLYKDIEQYSFDKANKGYIEAFTREWKEIEDLRLSEKDDNERKTTNTHLHIIEAYANLYQVWPDKELHDKIIELLNLFRLYIIDVDGHLRLFFDDHWNSRSFLQSFGHDIEAGWLLLTCAETIADPAMVAAYKNKAIQLTNAATRGIDELDGGLWYEYDLKQDHWIREKHSWPQAEALIGFFNAWQLTGQEQYFRYTLNSWKFIKSHIRDNKNGEWFWGVLQDYSVMPKEKAGFWKCPYHNGRACLELIRRITMIV